MIKISISVTSHALDPPLSITNYQTFSDPLHPLERDVLYGRPLSGTTKLLTVTGKEYSYKLKFSQH